MKYKNGSEIVFGKVKDPLRGGKPMNLHQEIDEEFMRVIGDDEFLGYPFAQSGSGKRFLQFLHTFASRIVESVDEDVIGEMENPVGRDEYARNKLRDEMRTKLQMIKADTLIGDR